MKKQFNLQDWLKDKSQKVETRDGRPARIICTDAKADDGACIIALIPGYGGEEAYQLFPDGRAFSSKSSAEDCADLFLVTPEPELTEFEKAFDNLAESYHSDGNPDEIACCKEYAAELLEIGRKEIIKQGNIVIPVDDFNKRLCVAMEHAREEALKDLPRWKKCSQNTIYSTKCNLIVNGIGRYIILDGYMIDVDRLKKLPGFKEDE